MSWIKLVAVFIYGVIFYILISLAASVLPIFANVLGIGLGNGSLGKLQRDYYFHAPMRSMLQGDAACVMADKALGYRPPDGDCKFENFEFSTKLKFNGHRAVTPEVSNPLANIMVIGDSHAMGWGSSFDETFSYLLGQKGYAVTNLAMSSYATEQEILSALRSDGFRAADYIILQYCDNDFPKNQRSIDSYASLEFDEYSGRSRKEFEVLDKVRNAARLYLKNFSIADFFALPVNIAKSQFRSEVDRSYDGGEHKKLVLDILSKYPSLSGKKLLIFYVNGHGSRFHNWEGEYSNTRFVDLDLNREHFYSIDDHLNRAGHRAIAEKLHHLISGQF